MLYSSLIAVSGYLLVSRIRFLKVKSFQISMLSLLVTSYFSLVGLNADTLIFCNEVDRTYNATDFTSKDPR